MAAFGADVWIMTSQLRFHASAFTSCNSLHQARNENAIYLFYSHSTASLSDFFVDASGPNTFRYMAASRNRCLASSFLLVGFEGYPMISVLDAMSSVCCLSHYRYVVH